MDEMQRALDVARNIDRRATETLEGLRRTMLISGWKPEYQSIMWEAVARKALSYAAATPLDTPSGDAGER